MATASHTKSTAPAHLGYPSLRKAAEILGVNVSSLSRRELDVVAVGAQKRLPPQTVMQEAAYFNRRDPNEVAADLVELAEDQCPEAVEGIEDEITEYLQSVDRGITENRPDDEWLAEAERFLPAGLFERVQDVYSEAEEVPAGLSGPPPS
jgi:hypothetical protein